MIGLAPLCNVRGVDIAVNLSPQVLAARLHWKLKRQRELAKRGGTPCTPSPD